LFIRGGLSNYIEDDDARLIRQIFPQAEIATLAQAGHWVHVDLPEEFFKLARAHSSSAPQERSRNPR
jgi:hypothetical protein